MEKIIKKLHKIEDFILVGFLLLMIIITVLQIFLRNFFSFGIIWGDSLVRILVLWIALLGAMVASKNDNHISIDILSRYLPENYLPFINIITYLFTSIICFSVVYYSITFVYFEYTDKSIAFGIMPAWICEVSIPLAFLIIGLRYFVLFIINFKKIVKS